MTEARQGPSRTASTASAAIGVVLGIVVAILTSDVILGAIAGAPTVAILVGLVRLWAGGEQRPRHP